MGLVFGSDDYAENTTCVHCIGSHGGRRCEPGRCRHDKSLGEILRRERFHSIGRALGVRPCSLRLHPRLSRPGRRPAVYARLGSASVSALSLRSRAVSLGSHLPIGNGVDGALPCATNFATSAIQFDKRYSTMTRLIALGFATAILALGFTSNANAAAAAPALRAASPSHDASTTTTVRWLCGPYRCHWVPGYRGRVYVVPRARYWGAPPNPHCYYKKSIFGWVRICP